MEPSYKIGMFFSHPWWTNDLEKPKKYSGQYPTTYPAKLTSYFLTLENLNAAVCSGFPIQYECQISREHAGIINTSFDMQSDFITAVEQCIEERLSIKQEN
jgi:hypothetical protein